MMEIGDDGAAKLALGGEHCLGVISDVHAEDERLSRVLFWMRTQGIQHIACAGDIVDGRGDAEQCCALLRGVKALVVQGNHDQWFIEGGTYLLSDTTPQDAISEASRAFLEGLPKTRDIRCQHGQILLCHGVGEDNMCSLNPYDAGYALQSNTRLQELLQRQEPYALMIHGHTHQRAARRIGGMVTLNPGALSDRRNEQPGFAVLDCHAWQVTFYDLHDDTIEVAEQIDLTSLPNER